MDYLILGLATWRISNLLVNEDGPWEVFTKLRDILGVRFDEHSKAYGTNVISRMLACIWCLTPWLGLLVTLGYWLHPVAATWVAMPFALSTIAIVVERMANGR